MTMVAHGRPRGKRGQQAMPWRGGDRSQCWATPKVLFDEIERRYGRGGFTIDIAASDWSAKCHRFLSEAEDALNPETVWCPNPRRPERVWCNPPFDNIDPFIRRAHAEVAKGLAEVAVFLVPARVGSAWWHEVARPYGHIHDVRGRISFQPPPGFTGDATSHGEDFVIVVFERAIHGPDFKWRAPSTTPLLDLVQWKDQ